MVGNRKENIRDIKKEVTNQPRECEILDGDLRSWRFEPMVCGLAGDLEQVWLMVNLPTRPRVSAVTTILTLVFNQHPAAHPVPIYTLLK